MSRRRLTYICVSLLAVVVLVVPAARAELELGIDEGYYTIVDSDGKQITCTSIVVEKDDVFIDSQNRLYTVEKVTGKTAEAKFVRIVELEEASQATSLIDRLKSFIGLGASPETSYLAQYRSQPIALYNTHSDESYVPTSGTDSKTWGDVYKVSEVLDSVLSNEGVRVVRSTDNFLPHDGAAYERSRRTALNLVREHSPAALIDVHRDATQPNVYQATVAGKQITKVKLVVGRENTNSSANLEFAKRLKAAADKQYPGLVEGIFWGHGNYNQDLSPRAILFEVGAHTNSLQEAEEGASLMARVLPTVVYGAASTDLTKPSTTGTVGRTLLWVVGGLIVIGLAFILLNEKGWQGIKSRLFKATSREFSPGPKDPRKDDGTKD